LILFSNQEFAQDVSAAALYLVAKLGPSPRPPRDVANVYKYLLSPSSSFFRDKTLPPPANDPATYHLSEGEYISFHSRLLRLEGRILYALGFETHVALPHALAVTYMQALDFLGGSRDGRLAARALALLNAALLSPQLLCVTHAPAALAAAAVYGAARDVGAKMPECEWWEVFDVDREALGFLVVGMRSLEGWARVRRDKQPELWKGMVTRGEVRKVMQLRGLSSKNGAASGAEDVEDQMMREMDATIATLAGNEKDEQG
jgi:cyclin L